MTRASAEDVILAKCLARLSHWRVPMNYDCREWRKELAAVSAYATVVAEREYDASRGVPRDAFLYNRVLAALISHYRQEWRFASRHPIELTLYCEIAQLSSPVATQETLTDVMPMLPDADRHLLTSLFWEGRTEAELAAQLTVTQQAVSKRKAMILNRIRQTLSPTSAKLAGTSN
jgi:DNA-directed RNA polymerase specialized sigma24 family protein